jgi:formate dehydrogenase maturation protein FdhE
MLQTPRPTPTCTRFGATIEMPCIKCGEPMRLALIEPRNQNFDLVTYRCIPCDSNESFLKSLYSAIDPATRATHEDSSLI